MVKPPTNDDTPLQLEVKQMKGPATGVTFQFRLKDGMLLQAFQDALRAREETPQQLMRDLLEPFLISEGYLPAWWLTRGKGIE